MLSKIFLTGILFILLAGGAFAQPKEQHLFTKANGLPDNNVTCMLTDKQGFIWLGTLNGLCRFDGSHFYVFPPGNIESDKLPGDIILDLEEDGDYILVAHRFGLTRINKYSFTCKNYQDTATGSRYSLRRSVRDIYKDKQGNVWLGGSEALLKYDRQNDKLLTIADIRTIIASRFTRQVSKVIPGPTGESLLLLLVKGWMKYDIKQNKLDTHVIRQVPIALLKGQNVRLRAYWNTFLSEFSIRYDSIKQEINIDNHPHPGNANSVINFYVDDNLQIILNQENNQVKVFNKPSHPASLASLYNAEEAELPPFNFIQYSRGIKCMGTKKGLQVLNTRQAIIKRYPVYKIGEQNGMPGLEIMDVAEWDADKWVIGAKTGIYLVSKEEKKIQPLPRWKDSAVYKLLVLPDKKIWISTEDFLHLYDWVHNKILTTIKIESYAVSLLYENNLTVAGTRSHGVVTINMAPFRVTKLRENDKLKQITNNRITAITKIGNSGSYFITYNDLPGHYSINHFAKNTYSTFAIPVEAFRQKEIFPLITAQPVKNGIWFGCYLAGAIYYDSTRKLWKNILTQDGLSNSFVKEILCDEQGRAWLITGNGVDVYSVKENILFNFPVTFNSGGRKNGFVAANGRFVFFDNENIAEVNPQTFSFKTAVSSLVVSMFEEGGRQGSPKNGNIKLTHLQNTFLIRFSLQKINPLQRTKYAYRLSIKEQWKEIGTETQLSFANLAPGNYQLEIKATDEFGQWKYFSYPFQIVITPPFWLKLWFVLLAATALFFAVWLLQSRRNRRKINELKKQNEIIQLRAEKHQLITKERERIITDLHDDVGATLSSLHIYGDLANNVWDSQPEKSKNMVSNISKQSKELMTRMSDIVWSLKTPGDEKNSFALRLKNYSQDLLAGKNITAYFEIDEALAGRMTSPLVRKNLLLIAKEAMNNIAKYSGAKNAEIRLSQTDDKVLLVICDDGNGISASANLLGNGLDNMKKRCEQLNGDFIIESTPGKGVTISCQIPIATISHLG